MTVSHDRTLFAGRAGFSLMEMLVAMVLLAVLMAAVATATKGAFQSYSENTKVADAAQAARVVLNRLTTEVRTSANVTWAAQKITITPAVVTGGVTQTEYELVNGVLYYRQTIGGVRSQALLGDGDNVVVDSFTIPTTTTGGAITAKLDLHVGNNHFNVTASAFPRRINTY